MTEESNLNVTCTAVEWISPKVEEPRRGPISVKVFATTPFSGSPGAIPKGSCGSEEAHGIVASAVAHHVPGRF